MLVSWKMLEAWLVFLIVGSSLPMKYLGLLLGASFMVNSIWNGIIKKMKRRLAVWK